MRQIGTINDETQARLFGDYLYAQGITNEVEEAEAPGGWAVWVHDEDRLDESAQQLERFRRNPNTAEFKKVAVKAAQLRAEERKNQKEFERRFRSSEEIFPALKPYRPGLLSIVLICICGFVAFKTNLGSDPEQRAFFFISNQVWSHPLFGKLYEVRHGEVWRLISPIVLHFGTVHLICNLLWLFQLGSLIESRLSSWALLAQVLVIGVVSNLAQYLVGGYRFGGMSGVVYGLFGYVWIRGHLDPAIGMLLDRTTVALMLVWFFLCFTGWVGPIANIAHTTGLLMGMAWGFLAAKFK